MTPDSTNQPVTNDRPVPPAGVNGLRERARQALFSELLTQAAAANEIRYLRRRPQPVAGG